MRSSSNTISPLYEGRAQSASELAADAVADSTAAQSAATAEGVMEQQPEHGYMGMTVSSMRKTPRFSRVVIGLAALASICCSAQSRISGTYVACETNAGAMLQLTQSTGGQITGVLSIAELDGSGEIKADTSSITGGTLDGSQLTLTLHPGIFGTNISGTREGNTIRLQSVDRNGLVSSSKFARNSASVFNICATHLQKESEAIKLNEKLASQVQQFRQTIRDTEAWIQSAQSQASKIPATENHYGQIQNEMKALLETEKKTSGAVDRSQISIDVNQKSIDGNIFDIDVNQSWDWPIESQLKTITAQLASWVAACNLGATDKPVTDSTVKSNWETECRNIRTEQSNLESIARKVMEQRAELKAYQLEAKSLRDSIVQEAQKVAQ